VWFPVADSVTLGHWWLATTHRHVTFESWCERDYLIAFDFDPDIVGIAVQPFRVEFTTHDGARRPHVPDYFLRTAEGGGSVIDIKPDDLIDAKDRISPALQRCVMKSAGPIARWVSCLSC
jgi:hypothetical protein